MSTSNLAVGIALSAALLCSAALPAQAQDMAVCVRTAADLGLAAKTRFQRGLRNLIVERRPEFAALADVNMELQILLAQARRARFDYLLKFDPGRIDTAHGSSRFSNFAWSDTDRADFAARSDAYREQEARLAALESRNNGHPDWPRLRQFFRAELSQEADFGALTDALQARQRAVEETLAQCRPARPGAGGQR